MKSVVLFTVLMLFSYGEWILSEAGPAPIAKQISVPGDYTKISDAIRNGVPNGNKEWILINVASGVYTEGFEIPYDKPYVIIKGGGSDNTIVAWNTGDNANIIDAAFAVKADNFIAKDITFKNTHDLNGLAPGVATSIQGDKCSFYNCKFIGQQDTIADFKGRHLFSSCYVEGVVDFIFGGGTSIYQNCTLNATAPGYVTAQGREKPDDASGFVFKSAKVVGKGPTYLGRAWRGYARVLFYQSTFDNIIDPKGWDAWGNPETQLSFSEVDCSGPGANQTGRVHWTKSLSSSEMQALTSMSFIDREGWLENQPSI